MRASVGSLLILAAPVPSSAAAQSVVEPVDCADPARAAQPGPGAWHQREAENAFCATQRNLDTKTNPLYHAATLRRPPNRASTAMDPCASRRCWPASASASTS